jgi:hypothetical protein
LINFISLRVVLHANTARQMVNVNFLNRHHS